MEHSKPRATVDIRNVRPSGGISRGVVTYKLNDVIMEREDFVAIQLGDISNALERIADVIVKLDGPIGKVNKIADDLQNLTSDPTKIVELIMSGGMGMPGAAPAPGSMNFGGGMGPDDARGTSEDEFNLNELTPEELADLGVEK